ncbi:MAG: hypothetical protein NHF98_00120 [Candidatus Bostrichicola ureolyticus]|nr:MAG: hypothetical protein NHF98_00120 [Candidatus Bostrichicola ureolyticus]
MTFIIRATDLIGSYILLYLLKKGKKVIVLRTKKCIDILKHIFNYYYPPKETNYLLQNIEWVKGFDISIFKEVNEVYYTNNLIGLWQGKKIYNKNYITDIINICIATGVKKICYINSIFISNDMNYITELFLTKELFNLNTQFISEIFLSEIEVLRGSKEGLNVVIANPSIILASGFWDKKNLFELINKCGYSKGIIGCIDARDVAKCCIRLMDQKKIDENNRYILNSENISYKELINNGNNILNSENISYKEFKNYIKFFNKNYIFSNEKIIKILKYKFIPVKESIKEHIERYKKECY